MNIKAQVFEKTANCFSIHLDFENERQVFLQSYGLILAKVIFKDDIKTTFLEINPIGKINKKHLNKFLNVTQKEFCKNVKEGKYKFTELN